MTDTYDIGYGKPPKSGQYKKGESGNLKGRTKGTKNLKTDLAEELGERVVIKEGGVKKKISKQRAMLKNLTAKAIMGDARAANIVLSMVLKLFSDDTEPVEELDLSAADQAILDHFEKKILDKVKNKEKKDDK